MEKLVYLLFQKAEFPGNQLREALLHEAAPALRAGGAHWISINVHDEDVVRPPPTGLERWEDLPSQRWISDPPARAMVSFWMQCAEERAACERALESHAVRISGYLVSESVPLINADQRAPIGQRTPGFNQVSSLVKRRDVSDDEFRDIWLHDQKLVAIECQSSFGYKRNSIVRPMTAGARNYLGIVEENFPIEALTDPRVFYDANSDAQLRERVERMTRNVERFLQMDEVELTPMSEYLLG